MLATLFYKLNQKIIYWFSDLVNKKIKNEVAKSFLCNPIFTLLINSLFLCFLSIFFNGLVGVLPICSNAVTLLSYAAFYNVVIFSLEMFGLTNFKK